MNYNNRPFKYKKIYLEFTNKSQQYSGGKIVPDDSNKQDIDDIYLIIKYLGADNIIIKSDGITFSYSDSQYKMYKLVITGNDLKIKAIDENLILASSSFINDTPVFDFTIRNDNKLITIEPTSKLTTNTITKNYQKKIIEHLSSSEISQQVHGGYNFLTNINSLIGSASRLFINTMRRRYAPLILGMFSTIFGAVFIYKLIYISSNTQPINDTDIFSEFTSKEIEEINFILRGSIVELDNGESKIIKPIENLFIHQKHVKTVTNLKINDEILLSLLSDKRDISFQRFIEYMKKNKDKMKLEEMHVSIWDYFFIVHRDKLNLLLDCILEIKRIIYNENFIHSGSRINQIHFDMVNEIFPEKFKDCVISIDLNDIDLDIEKLYEFLSYLEHKTIKIKVELYLKNLLVDEIVEPTIKNLAKKIHILILSKNKIREQFYTTLPHSCFSNTYVYLGTFFDKNMNSK